jgi:hypothetical protein
LTSCVTIFALFSILGHARVLLRYLFCSFWCFRARKGGLALPFLLLFVFSGTQGWSRVTVFAFICVFRHARVVSRYRFCFYWCFQARKGGLALPFLLLFVYSGMQEYSCLTVFALFVVFRHARVVLSYRFTHFCVFGQVTVVLRYRFCSF